MLKSLSKVFILLAATLLLTACPKKQGPTVIDTTPSYKGSGNTYKSVNSGSDSLIPDSQGSDWSESDSLNDLDAVESLEARGSEGVIANGKFGDWDMVTGILPSVFFGFDSSSIASSERSKLQEAADYLIDNPSESLLIEGHCDWYGTSEYNLALGDRRANSARDYLTTLGISADRIETLSKGSLNATSGLSKSDAAQDRRADLIILK